MRISDVEKITGLTSKAIRFYEDRGLINVRRSQNTYREYDTDTVELLKHIKMLRDIGVSVTDIKLFISGIMPLDELLNKRKGEIEKENKDADIQYLRCIEFMNDKSVFEIIQNEVVKNDDEVIVGIDIGTTTISTVVYDFEIKKIEEIYTIPNDSNIETKESFKEQNAEWILDRILKIVEYLKKKYSKILSIGLTGQMHGILYVDKNGKAVSPLYTWQDGRGDERSDEITYCDRIKQITGEEIYTGYGVVTHYYNLMNNLVPETAETFCTVMDYIVMRLCKLERPLVHATNASSFGMFDVYNNKFKLKKIKSLNINPEILPEVTSEEVIAGYFGSIPVCVAIGDNQASVFSSIRNEKESIVVNYGTGSQVSAVVEIYHETDDFEIRPYLNGKYLLNYSALCGGRAYAILEKFFRSFAQAFGLKEHSQYELMNILAEKVFTDQDLPVVNTMFCGTRKNPSLRGSISNISEMNFTPEKLVFGFIRGMVMELFENYQSMNLKGIKQVIASGNAVRKNSVLQKSIADIFNMELFMTKIKEEAALGAAFVGAVASKVIDEKSLKECINLECVN